MVTLQHLLFPKPGICTDEALYFRRNARAYYAWSDDVVYFDRDGALDLDTYFNGISAEKYFKYSVVEKIWIKLKVQGVFRITLMRKEKLGASIMTEFISEDVITTEGQVRDVPFAFDCKNAAGMYCVRILSMENDGKYFGGEYYADVSAEKVRNVKIGIDICTFKREKFVEKNIKNLSQAFFENEQSPLYGHLEMFISDNAHTLPQTLSSEFVHIVQNKNVGGAGGFTRGLIEIIKDGNPHGITHALLMDDDIVLQPEAVFKTHALLSILKEEYKHAFVGGAMFRLDRQNIQVESGAVWNGGDVMSLKSGLDLRSLDACLYNELEETVDYNAWWYCTVPIENVRADNLPLPIFIRGDDVEYGLRNTRKLILMNGICVWHEPFENKYSSSMYYYIFRNRLIDNSVRGIRFSQKRLLQEFKEHVYNELFTLRYKNAELLLRGVEDYFRGIDWLKEQDGEKLHKDIMASGYKMQYVDELDFVFSYPLYERMQHIPQDVGFRGFLKKWMIKWTFHGLFLPADREKIVPTLGVHPRQLIRAKRSLNYDLASKKAFITEKSVKEALRLYFRYSRVVKLIKRRGKAMAAEYERRKGEITSLDFWNEYLGIEASAAARSQPADNEKESTIKAMQTAAQEAAEAEAVQEVAVVAEGE